MWWCSRQRKTKNVDESDGNGTNLRRRDVASVASTSPTSCLPYVTAAAATLCCLTFTLFDLIFQGRAVQLRQGSPHPRSHRSPQHKELQYTDTHTRLTALFRDYPGEPVPERYKKLSYRRGTARCVLSVVILPITTQQCRHYLYDKS